MREMIPEISQMTNQKQREAFEKAASELDCDEYEAAGKSLNVRISG